MGGKNIAKVPDENDIGIVWLEFRKLFIILYNFFFVFAAAELSNWTEIFTTHAKYATSYIFFRSIAFWISCIFHRISPLNRSLIHLDCFEYHTFRLCILVVNHATEHNFQRAKNDFRFLSKSQLWYSNNFYFLLSFLMTKVGFLVVIISSTNFITLRIPR